MIPLEVDSGPVQLAEGLRLVLQEENVTLVRRNLLRNSLEACCHCDPTS